MPAPKTVTQPRIARTITALLDMALAVRAGRLTNYTIAARLDRIALALDSGADGRETQERRRRKATRATR